MTRPLFVILLTLALASLTILMACSSDDEGPTDPDGSDPGDPQDTTAPQLLSSQPTDGGWIEPFYGQIVIQFNEDMDPESATGQVTTSVGTIESVDWFDPTTLFISVIDLPASATVTITIGTGLMDTAGNSLAAPATLTFYTIADQLALVETEPADGSLNVNRNANVRLRFSEPVASTDLIEFVTISDGNRTDYAFTVTEGERASYLLNADEVFPAETEITVEVGLGITGILSGTSLDVVESISFTTGVELDDTPPMIESIVPTSGSTIPTDQGTITVTFSEPVDLSNFSPPAMNGQMAWALNLAGQEPELSPDGTVLTVPLPDDLPAGLDLRIVLGGYEDILGNVQNEETAWSVTVAGAVAPFAFHDGERFTFTGTFSSGEIGSSTPNDSGDSYRFYETVARSTAGQWELREYEWEYSFMEFYDIFEISGSGAAIIGIGEDTGGGFEEILLSNPLTFTELPFVQGNSWSGSTSLTIPGEGTLTAEFSGGVIEQGDLEVGTVDGTLLTWTGAWQVNREIEITADSELVETEEYEFWIVPGIGIVRERSYEQDLDPEEQSWTTYDLWRDVGFTDR